MEHLSHEVLARLVGEDPTSLEADHLRSCRACAAVLQDLRRQTDELSTLPTLVPPRGDWEVLEARLISEGLIRNGGVRQWFAWSLSSGWMKAAAVVAIFAAGAVTGSAITEGGSPAMVAEADDGLRVVTSDDARSVDEAERAVNFAEEQYARSLLQYRRMLNASGRTLPGDDPVRRVRALDLLVQAGQNAVRAAPDDPYINSFLVSLLTERNASTRSASTRDNWF